MWRAMQGLGAYQSSVPKLARKLADLRIDADAAFLRNWAKMLSQADTDAVQYHAQGRLDEYVKALDLDTALRQMTCPVLLIQGNQALGGLVSDEDAEHALSLLADGVHVYLDGAGHDLGLDTWEVTGLLRAVTNFVESL
jgi:pimeloyl-ACP methyl ester carboxylesterase